MEKIHLSSGDDRALPRFSRRLALKKEHCDWRRGTAQAWLTAFPDSRVKGGLEHLCRNLRENQHRLRNRKIKDLVFCPKDS